MRVTSATLVLVDLVDSLVETGDADYLPKFSLLFFYFSFLFNVEVKSARAKILGWAGLDLRLICLANLDWMISDERGWSLWCSSQLASD